MKKMMIVCNFIIRNKIKSNNGFCISGCNEGGHTLIRWRRRDSDKIISSAPQRHMVSTVATAAVGAFEWAEVWEGSLGRTSILEFACVTENGWAGKG